MLALWCWQIEENMLAQWFISQRFFLVLAQCVHVRCSALTKRPMPRAALVAAAGTASASTRTHAVRHTTASHEPPPPTRREPALFLLPRTRLGLRLRFGLCRRSRKLRHTFLRLCLWWTAHCTHTPAPRDRLQRDNRNLGWAVNGQNLFCGAENPHD